jgi:cytosine deaminase
MCKMEQTNGTTALRAHVTVNELTELRGFNALSTLKREMRGRMDLQLVAFPGAPEELRKGDKTYRLLEKAIENGADAVGGCPHLSKDHRRMTDILCSLAGEAGLPVDFHVDESDEPNVAALEYLADKVLEGCFKHTVTAGHCTALSAVDDRTAARVIRKVAEAGINVVTLPSCNLYLMGRADREPKRRGITRVHELLEAGVRVVYGSDNIRDPFRPFGNGNLLEEGLLTAQLIQYGTDEGLLKVLSMASYEAAAVYRYEAYGLSVGAPADFVIFDQDDPVEVLLSQSRDPQVMKDGVLLGHA